MGHSPAHWDPLSIFEVVCTGNPQNHGGSADGYDRQCPNPSALRGGFWLLRGSAIIGAPYTAHLSDLWFQRGEPVCALIAVVPRC